MSKGGETRTTQTSALDPASQGYVNRMRGAGQRGYDAVSGAGPLFLGADPRTIEEQMAPFMNPYQSQVIGGVRNEFDYLRGQARRNTTDAAIQSGAYGGSRHGVAEGTRLGALDRAQGSQIAGLLSSGFSDALGQGLQYSEYQRSLRERQAQDPIFRNQAALGLLNMGMGPTGMNQTNVEKQSSDPWGQLLGLGLTAGGFFLGGPPGAAAGASVANGWGGYGG